MNKFFDTVFLDNRVRDYLLVACAILIVLILKRYMSRYIAGLLFSLVKRIARGVDKLSFINLVMAPLRTFLMILVTVVALDKLTFPRIFRITIYKSPLPQIVETISIIILIIAFIWLLLRIIDFIAMILEQKANHTQDATTNQLIVFFKDFFKVVFVINGILLVLKFGFKLHIGNIITGLSIAGAAIALATRESLENLIASFIIFFDKPFAVGDQVKVQSVTGTVEKIGLRSTRIRTDQKTFVTVPNKQMVDTIMDNLSLRTQRRAFLQLEINAATAHFLVHQLVNGIEKILELRSDKVENYNVFLADINKNAFVIHVEFFTAPIPIAEFNAVRQDVNLAIIQLMDDMNVKLAPKETEIIISKDI